jgi:DNA-binding transcriptional LysR family regulator
LDLRKIDLRLLEVLEATHRLGSLTAASEELHLSQPALSHALSRLRTAFADPLFVRTSRGMQPTPRADQTAESARRILAMVRAELGPVLPFSAEKLERTFRLGMTDVGEMVILPTLVRRLRNEAPHVNVVSMTMPARKLSEGLEAGTIDLAIGPFPDLFGAELKQRILFERGFRCLLSSEHPRISGDSLTIEEFLAEPHLVVFSLGRVNEAFERFLGEKKLSRRIMLSVPHMLCVPSVIAHTDLIATVPQSAAQNFRNLPGLKILEPPLSPPNVRVGLYWSDRFSRDPANAWLRAALASLFNER